MRPSSALTVMILGSALLLIVACSPDDEEVSADPTAVGSPDQSTNVPIDSDGDELTSPSPTDSISPDPSLPDTGSSAPIIDDGQGTSGVCEAHGSVNVFAGEVTQMAWSPFGFTAEVGELVYNPDGTLFDEPVLVNMPVIRTVDGKIEVGRRDCEFTPDGEGAPAAGDGEPLSTPPPDSGWGGGAVERDRVVQMVVWTTVDGTPGPWSCEAGAIVGIENGVVVNATLVPNGFPFMEGVKVFVASGERFVHPTRTNRPVHRDDQGALVLGWRLCVENPDFVPAESIPY